MKHLFTLIIAISVSSSAFAQKQIKFNNQSITIEGNLVATHQYINNGVNDGTNQIYTYYDDDMKVLMATELVTDKANSIRSIFIYYVNINFINKSSSYVMERSNSSFKEPTIYAAKIALTEGKVINVKSMNWGDTEWTRTNDPIAQIYFNTKADAEKLITEISK